MKDAELSDVYVDGNGKLWRIVGICGEPTVIAQEIESQSPETPVTMRGGISGHMWDGWKRIHRPEKKMAPEQFSRPTDWHYDSQGYCDNPGRGY